MDNQKSEEPIETPRFDPEVFAARTTTPLPGSRDTDLDTAALPSARHAMKDEYSDYVKLAKQGGHQGNHFLGYCKLFILLILQLSHLCLF